MAGLSSKTYDPTVQADFTLGLANSGRSKCRNPKCLMMESQENNNSRKIAKGSLRIARMEASPTEKLEGRIVPKWVHLECCAPVILQEAVDRYGTGGIEGVPGFSELEPDKQAEAADIAMTILGITEGKKKKKIEQGDTIIDKKKKKKGKEGTNKEGKRKKKKPSNGDATVIDLVE